MLYRLQPIDQHERPALSLIAHVLHQWELLRSSEATELVELAFNELSDVGHVYLDVADEFSFETKIRLGSHSTPPRFYFDDVLHQMNVTKHETSVDYAEQFSAAQKLKAVLTVGIIERFRDFFARQPIDSKWHSAGLETCDKAHLQHALHITGTIVRQVINHLSDTRQAEINFSKNPWTASGIPLRRAAPS